MATKHICDRCGADATSDYALIKFEWLGYRRHSITTGPDKSASELCPDCEVVVRDAIHDALFSDAATMAGGER